jgi:glycosyltransferase involved in cell wall biosynthesis
MQCPPTDVSVVLPTHNRLHLLPVAIGSVLRQDGVVLELIVVDDGSTDGTGAWLDRFASAEPRVKVVHHDRPRLMSGARNAGIAQASSPWVAFCDDDDVWAPGKLAAQLCALQASSARWGCTGVVVVDDGLEIVGHHHAKGGQVLSGLLEANIVPTGSSVIADLRLVREIGGFDNALLGSEDWDLWIRLARHSPLAAIDRPLIAYRLGMISASMNVGRMRTGHSHIVERYASWAAECGVEPDRSNHERYLAKQLLRAGARWKAASIFATLATRHKRWRELPRVAAALLAPRLTDRLGRARAQAAVPTAWNQEADAWLRPFRDPNREHAHDSSIARH